MDCRSSNPVPRSEVPLQVFGRTLSAVRVARPPRSVWMHAPGAALDTSNTLRWLLTLSRLD
eukprot:3623017-Alexandrium_andersonii.AAC.1